MPATTPVAPQRRITRLSAVAIAALLALTGCVQLPMPTGTGPDAADAAAAPVGADAPVEAVAETTIPVLYAKGDGTGGVSSIAVRITPNDSDRLAVEVSEDEVGGVGQMLQAASWNAVMVATLLTGADLSADYRFELTGRVDGPSAGGITTAALLSLMNGHEILPDVAMTGTITPTGTIGPVGGIPSKMQGVIDDGRFTKVVVPLGSRNSVDADGRTVDVVRMGADAGIEVVEVGDISEAYRHLTGETLPGPVAASAPKVDQAGFAKLEAAAKRQLTSFAIAESEYGALSEIVREIGAPAYDDAVSSAQSAERLLQQGLPGGALVEALGANLIMKAIAGTYSVIDGTVLQGEQVLVQRLNSAGSAQRVFVDYLDQLDTYRVKSVADAETLMTAYGNAFDAYALYDYARADIQSIADKYDSYESLEDFIFDALTPLIYLEFSVGQIEAAAEVFEIGRDQEGPALDADADVQAVAEFFRKAADANLEVFDSLVIAPTAEDLGMSEGAVRSLLGNRDLSVALAGSSQGLLALVTDYLGDGNPNADYAAMGYGWINYARNASLLEKYATNGVVDWSDGSVVGVRSDALLSHTLEFSRSQLAGAVGALGEQDYVPVLITGTYEAATIAREGDYEEKFGAIQDYTGAFAMSRVLAYLGGFAAQGYRG